MRAPPFWENRETESHVATESRRFPSKKPNGELQALKGMARARQPRTFTVGTGGEAAEKLEKGHKKLSSGTNSDFGSQFFIPSHSLGTVRLPGSLGLQRTSRTAKAQTRFARFCQITESSAMPTNGCLF